MYEPWGMCNKETNDDPQYSGYTLNGCLQDCYIKQVIEACNCKPHYAGKYKPKETKNITECTVAHYIEPGCKYAIPEIKKSIQPENCTCLLPCQYKEYVKSTSYAQYPSEYMSRNFQDYFPKETEYLKEGMPEDEYTGFSASGIEGKLRENLIYLDIYFDDLKYELAEENKADKEASLISDVGGQLGLWLGCSILTLVEIFYCCCVVMPKHALVSAGVLDKKVKSGLSASGNQVFEKI